jgi:hypothetical protein
LHGGNNTQHAVKRIAALVVRRATPPIQASFSIVVEGSVHFKLCEPRLNVSLERDGDVHQLRVPQDVRPMYAVRLAFIFLHTSTPRFTCRWHTNVFGR